MKTGRSAAAVLLTLVFVFQTTVLSDTAHLSVLSRLVNALMLLGFIGISIRAFMIGQLTRLPAPYIIGVVLVIAGLGINIFRSLSLETLGYSAALLPWFAMLSVPFMRSYDFAGSWRLMFRLLVIASFIAAFEYGAMLLGILPLTSIDTERGTFLKGILTLFHGLDDGTVYLKMYGLFPEPGTYAMYLIPGLAYALVFGRRAALVLFAVCLYYTTSLGGLASAALLAFLFLFSKARGRPSLVALLLVCSFATTAVLYPIFSAIYAGKGESAAVRVSNVQMFREGFFLILQQAPLGMPLGGRSLSELQAATTTYLGSNFELYSIFVKGGVLALLGYTLIFVWVTLKALRFLLSENGDPYAACAFLSLPPLLVFVWQRETVLSSALFSFLFAYPMIFHAVGAERAVPVHAGDPVIA